MLTKDDLKEIKNLIEPLENRMGNMENRMGNMENRMGNMENRMGGLENKIDDLTLETKAIHKVIETMTENHGERIKYLEERAGINPPGD